MTQSKITLFDNQKIRRIFHEDKWYFSVIDVVLILTNSTNPRDYWYKMKIRVSVEEGNELSTICRQLKMTASDGKNYETDCADVETLLRIIQSIPSPKAEPFKKWLAKVGYERMQEISDPEMSLNRARENWKKHGRSEKWISQRMTGQETRNKLTDYWRENEINEGEEFAVLTNIIHQEWSGISVKEHKKIKNLKSQNLRDHMTEEELIFTALAELSTRRIAEKEKAVGMDKNVKACIEGGKVSKKARIEFEKTTETKVVSQKNYLPPKISSKTIYEKPPQNQLKN